MRIPLLAAALSLVAGMASATIRAPPLGSAIASSAVTDTDATEPQPLFAVPTLRDRSGRLVAPVVINGQGPFHFLLDTGATHTAITEAAAQRLGLTPDAAARSSVRGVNGNVIVPRVYLESLVAGALRLEQVLVPQLTGSALDGLDGVLGMDGLKDLRVTADFRKDRVTISKSTGRQASRDHAIVRGKLVSERLFMVEARIGRIPVKAIFDTGASHTLGNPALLAALSRRREFRGPAPIGSVADATATLQDGVIHLTPNIDLAGGAGIRNTDITFSDFAIFKVWGLEAQPAVLVGMDVLGTLGEFTIDYRRMELQVRMKAQPLVRRL